MGFVLLAFTTAQAGGVSVTFQVKMNIKMLEGTFAPGSGDIVSVNGSFNGWASAVDTLKDPDGDSVYTKTVPLALIVGDTIQYKFWKTLRGGIDWESGDNRMHIIATGSDTLSVEYFDHDSVYTPPVPAAVTFQVNMKIKMLEGSFLPGSGDIVRVAGSFNNWGSSTDTLTDPDHDSVYTKTISNNSIFENTTVQYKFLKTLRSGLDWESGNNRTFDVPVGGATVPVVYFDYDTVANTQVTASILWQVDMTTYEDLGWFRPDLGDTMQLRGPFNGWGGTKMDQSLLTPGVFQLANQLQGAPSDLVPYKFYMQLDSPSAATRFPGYGSNQDGIKYDHPATRGDGNRLFDIQNGGELTTELAYFSDINPKGEIAAGDTVTVTVTANMGPALSYLTPLNPSTDTVRLVFQDALSRAAQQKIQGSFPQTLDMSHASPTDTIYTVSFNIIGPAHYNLQYTFRYVQPGGFAVDQGGGLGSQNLFTSRFIQPLAFGKTSKSSKTSAVATTWPRNYSTPVDDWQKNPPLAHETPPFDIINGVGPDQPTGRPVAYRLFQNYPNPFNPATQIRYSLPERSHVSLKVYNLLGQEIATLINQDETAGNYIALFEANKLPSGVYFYKLQAGGFRDVKKMVLIR
jgi:hypothetical protein